MRSRRVSCVIDGDTYLGTYATVVIREDQAVRVSYKQSQRTAKADSRTTGLVARDLLGSMVKDDLARGHRTSTPAPRPASPALAMGERTDRDIDIGS